MNNFMRRMFNDIKIYTKFRVEMKSKSKVISINHKQLKIKVLMNIWMKALDNESKIKIIERTHQRNLM
jgi:hypothetical protein